MDGSCIAVDEREHRSPSIEYFRGTLIMITDREIIKMAKTTVTYWNPLSSENREHWQPIKGLEGIALVSYQLSVVSYQFFHCSLKRDSRTVQDRYRVYCSGSIVSE
jgi:hypothetical protein